MQTRIRVAGTASHDARGLSGGPRRARGVASATGGGPCARRVGGRRGNVGCTTIRAAPATRPEPAQRFTIAPDTDEAFPSDAPGTLALSPDGARMVYLAGDTQADLRLFIRSFDRHSVRPLAGTEGAWAPFFSPDGQWVAFFAETKLKKVSVNGGPVLPLCVASRGARGGAWGPNDTIVFAPDSNVGLFSIPATGGEPEPLTKVDSESGESSHRWPDVLPGGTAVLFTIKTSQNLDEADIAVLSLETGEYHTLLSGGSNARYVRSGHVVFGHNGALMAFPFDLQALERTGPPGPVVDDLVTSEANGAAAYAVSTDGLFVYAPGGAVESEGRSMFWINRDRTREPLAIPTDLYWAPRLSPDGTRIAVVLYSDESGVTDIWTYDLESETLTRLTFEGDNRYCMWTPDSSRIVFTSDRLGTTSKLYWKPADGSGPAERLTTGSELQIPYDVSTDGSLLAYTQTSAANANDLWILPLEGERTPRPFLQTPFDEVNPTFSPDGRWIAYRSDETGRLEIFVRPHPGPGGHWQVSRDGGANPVWSRDGTRIYFRNRTRMMGVSVTTGDVFAAMTPEVLFEGEYFGASGRQWDVSADGSRFLMMEEASGDTDGPPTFRVITNWFTELEQLVPTGQ